MAQWRSGNAAVCKTATAGVRFPSAPQFWRVGRADYGASLAQ